MHVRFVPYDQIDRQKWDDCIDSAVNSLIYARTFYLDEMAESWDGLVLGDYHAVMPLTYRQKMAIKYLYQPAFIQQGGIFFLSPLSSQQQEEFIRKAYEHFLFAEITLNFANNISDKSSFEIRHRLNHVLLLDKPYESIREDYGSIAVKNLKRAKNSGLAYSSSSNFRHILSNYETQYAHRLPSFSKKDFQHFGNICTHLSADENLITREVKNEAGEPVAGVVILKDLRRLYNIISFVNEKGKLQQANYYLYDQLLREFSGTGLLFDFEGSDVSGIATFYKRFSPVEERYPFLKFNHLPWPLKLLKR